MTKKRATLKSLMSIFLMILTAMMINTNSAWADWDCPPGDGWNQVKTSRFTWKGYAGCSMEYKYCWRVIEENGVTMVQIYVHEINQILPNSCIGETSFEDLYSEIVEECTKDIIQNKHPWDQSALYVPKCSDGWSDVVYKVGRPRCITNAYLQWITPMTNNEPDNYKWGSDIDTATAYVVNMVPNSGINSNLNNVSQVNPNHSSSHVSTQQANTVPNSAISANKPSNRLLDIQSPYQIRVISPCYVFERSVCWSIRKYCFNTIWSMGRPQKVLHWEEIGNSLDQYDCPNSKEVYLYRDIIPIGKNSKRTVDCRPVSCD